VVKQLKIVKTGKTGTLIFDPETNSGRLVYPASSQDLGFTPLSGKFPDYMRVIPDKTSGEVGQFDAEYIYAFAQVNKALGASKSGLVKIDHNGGSAVALVHLSADDNFVGVLAPCRM
jgi:DNA polymerase-3 subunit beta